jgi:hypothetical protein
MGGAGLAVALAFAWWLHPVTISRPAPPPSARHTTAPIRSVPPPHLNFEFDTTSGNGMIGIVNREPFAWREVRVEVGHGDELASCPRRFVSCAWPLSKVELCALLSHARRFDEFHFLTSSLPHFLTF